MRESKDVWAIVWLWESTVYICVIGSAVVIIDALRRKQRKNDSFFIFIGVSKYYK
jgi:hypothetical protein